MTVVVRSVQVNTLKWRYKTGDQIYASSPVISADSTVYIGSYDNYIYAFSPDGVLKWRYQTAHYIDSTPAIGVDGTVCVGSHDHYIYAIYPSGALKWRFQATSSFTAFAAVGIDGTVYIGSNDHFLYAIKPDGTLYWGYQTGDIIYSSPAWR